MVVQVMAAERSVPKPKRTAFDCLQDVPRFSWEDVKILETTRVFFL